MKLKHIDMSVNILTEEQAKSIALESGKEAIQLFISTFAPDFGKPTEVETEKLLTVKQLAEYWQCHPQTIMKKKKKGELCFYQHGRKLFFKKSEIDKASENPIVKKSK